MKITGTGSRKSPIAIDDSEDEVVQELVVETSSHPNPPSNRHSPILANQRPRPRRERPTSKDNAKNLANSNLEGKRPQKRKRAAYEPPSGLTSGPSQVRLHPNSQPTAMLSKKAKKRRRKLERQPIEVDTYFPNPPTWPNDGNRLSNPPFHTMWPPLEAIAYTSPALGSFPMYDMSQNSLEGSASTSSWVASMAMTAEAPRQEGNEIQSSRSDFQAPPPPLPTARQNVSPKRVELPSTSHPHASTSGSNTAPVTAPISPPSSQPIGMKPDQDPSSKHGLFQIPLGSASKAGGPYIPNPARTLVMEQLPKSHRTKDFVNSWSKSACGAHPVYLSIDPQAAKALVEFATAELARKAWGSPRLGSDLLGIKTHQLKGRPREDLIKVWWYRVDGVGANAGVGEIEEGEIEGDAAEKEIEVPPKKETKKERKARLAKERLAKQATLQKLKPVSTPTVPSSHSPPRLSIPETSTKAPIPPKPLSLTPHNPIISPQIEYNQYLYPSMPVAYSLPFQPPPLAQISHHRPPLMPQSALEMQWRMIPGKPVAETHTAIESRMTSSQKGSVGSSIASSRSPSPAPHVTSVIATQAYIHNDADDLPAYEDMDVDDDMDLESPQTGKRSLFDGTTAPMSKSTPTTRVDSVIFLPSSAISNHEDLEASEIEPLDISKPSTPELSSTISIPPPTITGALSLPATPPLEPRAMKNTPKGPSYTRRSLIARQKVLEERITQSRMELGLVTASRTPVTVKDPSIPIIASPVSADASTNDDSEKQATEEHLRSLVLRSQRNKVKSHISTPTDPSPTSPLSRSPVLPPSTMLSPPSATSSQSLSLDDLAVSFITETIETLKTSPSAAPKPIIAPIPLHAVVTAVPAPAPAPRLTRTDTSTTLTTTKFELAAKQKVLEAQIAESKVLMAKLAAARTKQERESILALMRERIEAARESMEDGGSSTPIQTATVGQSQSQAQTPVSVNTQPGHTQVVKKWVESSHEYAGILIVSDDESDDDSD
ncbi:hypothetical protein H0H81_011700 [Sphagnurus paluster]|uniref:Uncharacterized protein n=1 Tax=Sphagnurus paluster TaxID=117069 RepID=A0A9P7GIZ6_9AGAR|nr:hypothetical protein H0H81_011700 [Sphagnurus paluster]